jgi:hypothetical protein
MNDTKPSVTDRLKNHFSTNKQCYRDFAMYSLGIAATVTTFAIMAKIGGKSIDAKWDAAQLEAALELGEEGLAVAKRDGNFMFVLPLPKEELLKSLAK